jgi:signal peptidase II
MNFLISLKEFKNHLLRKENIFFFIFIIIIFFLDRLSKLKIINNLNEVPFYVNDYINFDLIWNAGIGFGLLSTNSSLLYNLTTILIGTVIMSLIYFFILSNKIDKFIYSIIVGGALGNFYDRIIFKAVPDFVDLHYDNFHWFTFNVADIFITIGIFIYILKSFIVKN